MATGAELMLGWKSETKIRKMASLIGIKVSADLRDLEEDPASDSITKALDALYLPALMSLPALAGCSANPLNKDGYLPLMSPLGPREMGGWGLAVYFDPDEMGDEPEHAVLAVSLVGRYFPTFLDWYSPHGGSGDVWEITLDLLRDIEIARQFIMKIMPVFSDARIIFKELHY